MPVLSTILLTVMTGTLCQIAPVDALQAETALERIDIPDLKRHIAVLAADSLEGRQAGTQGAKAAAAYIRSELVKHERLRPGGPQRDWMQPFGANYANVLAELPAADDIADGPTILLGAHYDHVGFGNKSNSFGPYGRIHNGADDNASGCAALLEIAETLAHDPQPLPCRVLLAFWDAEEAGLFGSQHWVRSPTVPLSKLRLVVNVDMIGRLRENRVYVMGWRSAPGLRPLIVNHNPESALTFQFEQFVTSDSDHYSFYSARIPTLHFDTGKHSDYHRPTDDVEKLAWEGLLQITQLMARMTVEAARPASTGKFRIESWTEKPSILRADVRTPPPTRFGIAWDPKLAEAKRVRIVQVVKGSAAERAGLRVGDHLRRLAGWSDGTVDDLRTTITTSPTSPLPIVWERGEPAVMTTGEVVLAGDPVRIGCRMISDPPVPGAVLVTEVQATTPADRAGLRPGDYLWSINGESAVNSSNCLRLLDESHSEARLVVERKGRLETLAFRHPKQMTVEIATPSETSP